MNVDELEYKIELFDGYVLEIEASENITIYNFLNPKGRKVKELKSKDSALSIGPMTAIGKEILKHLEPIGDRKTKVMQQDDFEDIMTTVDEFVEEILDAKVQAEEIAAELDESIKVDKISEGIELLSEIENPLIWIANQIDWYTAGERMNILYAFLAYASQVILKNPISVIALGEGGSGKTHIEDVALSLMPEDYIINMKSATEAATYHYAKSDPYYFDGKIVNMGDMGGASDHEEAQAFKNLMKELQSDGYAKRIKQERTENGDFTNVEFELFGHPCITYTSVPGHEFDDQEMSRSIMLTPRMDNDLAVSRFKHLASQKNNRTSKLLEEKRSAIPKIKNIILALRDIFSASGEDKIEIENPYHSFVEGFLSSSKFFKRDIDKYNGILKVITALNGFNRKPFMGRIFTTKADIIIFLDIVEQYRKSISLNLSRGAEDVWAASQSIAAKHSSIEDGFTINDFIDLTGSTISKRSLRAYFSELNSNNIFKTNGKEGQSWIYVINSSLEDMKTKEEDIKLSEYDVEYLEWNYQILSEKEFLVKFPYIPPGDIKKCSDPPFWNKFLPEGK
jgi:hypothetical protein